MKIDVSQKKLDESKVQFLYQHDRSWGIGQLIDFTSPLNTISNRHIREFRMLNFSIQESFSNILY